MVDRRVAAEKQNAVGHPTYRPWRDTAHDAPLEMSERSRAEPSTCMLPEHKPVRRGREMIDLLAMEEPKPKPAKIRAVSYEAAID